MRARTVAVLLATLCLAAPAGCRSARAPTNQPRALPTLAAPTYSLGETRTGMLPVPVGMRAHSVQFGDADHGYALEWSVKPVETVTIDANTYSERYRALLFATADGGRTWTPRPLPAPVLDGPSLAVLGPQRIVISSEDWNVSTDGGRSYRRYPADGQVPLELQAAPHDVLWASGDCTPGPCFELIEHTPNGERRHKWTSPALPAPPEAASYGPDGRWWAFARDGGRLHAAVSADRGATWQAREVPAHPALASVPEQLGAQLSADGEDLWLLGLGGEPATGGLGRAAPTTRLKPTESPVYWLLHSGQGDQWIPQPGQGRQASGTRLGDTWAAVGGRMMIVAGVDGLGLLDDRWTPVTLPTRVDLVYQLADGTVVAGVRGEPVPAYFGRRSGRNVTWTPFALTLAR